MTKEKNDEKGINKEKESLLEMVGSPEVTDHQGESCEAQLPCRKLTDKLYECLAVCNCSFKLLFGKTSFCSWILHNHAELPGKKPPCCSADNQKGC